MSTTAKGNYYKRKTKKWFQERGYWTEYLESRQRIFAQGKVFFLVRDIVGADGISMNGKHVVFWQCKLGTKNIAEAIKTFNKFPFPKCDEVQRWIIVWTMRVSEPEIIEVPFES